MSAIDPVGGGRGSRRETFLSIREIVTRTLDAIIRVRRRLEAMRADGVDDERARLFIDDMVEKRRELEAAIDRIDRDASREHLDTFVQYAASSDNGESGHEAPDGDSPEEVARWQTAADEALSEVLLEVAQRIQNTEARELVENLVGLLGAHGRRVALGVREQRDL